MKASNKIGAVELADEGSQAQARYQYVGAPKPALHPVTSPAGHVLTSCEPEDHPWHRGLWFTIKYLDDDNFWEEMPPFGTQDTAAAPDLTDTPSGAEIVHRLDWFRPRSSTIAITETRRIHAHAVSESAYAIDLTFQLVPTTSLRLDRTPFTTWGGYGGLSYRAAVGWEDPRLSVEGTVTERPTGQTGRWASLTGQLPDGSRAGMSIFDSPDNSRHPTPWYGLAKPEFSFVNAAMLFHEPMHLDAGQELKLAYRVLVHDGEMMTADLNAAFDSYAEGS